MVVESYVCSEWVSGGPLIGSSIIIVLTADLHFRRTLDFPIAAAWPASGLVINGASLMLESHPPPSPLRAPPKSRYFNVLYCMHVLVKQPGFLPPCPDPTLVRSIPEHSHSPSASRSPATTRPQHLDRRTPPPVARPHPSSKLPSSQAR